MVQDLINQEVEARLEEQRNQIRREVTAQRRQSVASQLGNIENERTQAQEEFNARIQAIAEKEQALNEQAAELDAITEESTEEVIG